MKVAFWGIGIIILGVLGAVLINLFGNIAVTNQLNYTTMKNAVEAAMYDAIDEKYMSGFCLCTDKEKVNGKYSFTSRKDYDLVDVTYENGEMVCKSKRKNCSILQGERRIDKHVFAESFIRRFAEMVNNNKDYRIIFQEIIEYPPKVSVSVNSKDKEYLPTDAQEGYTIVNQMDSIIETWGDTQITEISPTSKPTSPAATTSSSYCYSLKTQTEKKSLKTGKHVEYNEYKWATESEIKELNNKITGDNKWKKVKTNVTSSSDCRGYCYYNSKTSKYVWGLKAQYGPDKKWAAYSSSKDPTTCDAMCYKSSDGKLSWKFIAKASSKDVAQPKIEENKCPEKSTSVVSGDCTWHYNSVTPTCVYPDGKTVSGKTITGSWNKSSCKEAYNSCRERVSCPSGSTYQSGCYGSQNWSVVYNDGKKATLTRTCYSASTPSSICTSTMKVCVCVS